MTATKTYAFPFLRKHWIDLVLVVLWLLIAFTVDAGKLSIPVEFWDSVATIGWSTVPAVLVWALAAFALNLREYRTKTAAEVLLIQAQAGRTEADKWHTYHATKIMRKDAGTL